MSKYSITDKPKILRFLDMDGAEKSVGKLSGQKIGFNFHFGFLDDYRIDRGSAGDSEEGNVIVTKMEKALVAEDH